MKNKLQTKKNTEATSSALAEQQLFERISKRAYELWEAGGCQHGHDEANWIQAEREVRMLDKK